MQLTMPETGRVSTRMEWNAGETRLRGETYVLVPCEATGLQRVCDVVSTALSGVVWGRVRPPGSVSLVFRLLRLPPQGSKLYELTSGSYVKIDDGVSPASYVRI